MEDVQSVLVGEKADIALIKATFHEADTNADGKLSREEFGNILQTLNPKQWTKDPLDKLFEAADANSNGHVECEELVNWVLGGKTAQDDASDSDMESSSSSSGSSIGDDEIDAEAEGVASQTAAERADTTLSRASIKSAHLQRQISRFKKHEEPTTTLREIYELLTMRDGRIGARLTLEDFVDIFHEMKLDGLGPSIPRLIPQAPNVAPGRREAEDLSVLEMSCIFKLLQENPEATLDDAFLVINAEKERQSTRPLPWTADVGSRADRRNEVKALGLDLQAAIGYKKFCRLMELISAAMRIDMENLLSVMVWVRTTRFEMTEEMAIAVMERTFLKVASQGCHILDTPVSENDFVRAAHSMGIIDSTEKWGIAHGKLAILFSNILRHMPRLRLERERKRYTDRGSLGKRPRRRKHAHRRVVGRTQLAILFEELFKRIPSTRLTYRSPTKLILTFLEKADSAGEGGQRIRLK
jgi:hypothetical protein